MSRPVSLSLPVNSTSRESSAAPVTSTSTAPTYTSCSDINVSTTSTVTPIQSTVSASSDGITLKPMVVILNGQQTMRTKDEIMEDYASKWLVKLDSDDFNHLLLFFVLCFPNTST